VVKEFWWKATSQGGGQIFLEGQCDVTLSWGSHTVLSLLKSELSFLLHTLQQKIPILFNGLDNPKIALPVGYLDPV